MRQEYECEKCGVESHVNVDRHEDVMSVVYKLEADHKKWSPECDQPVRKLRVRNKGANNAETATT